MLSLRWFLCVAMLVGMSSVWAGAASTQDFSDLKKEVEDLRARLAQKSAAPQTPGPIGRADALVGNKYGPNAAVTTKEGKLTVGGLVQVWAYSIQNDNHNYVAWAPAPFGNGGASNELNDNDGYRIRRAELKFALDITPEITAVILIDPTGGDEANTFPGLPSNQGLVGQGRRMNSSGVALVGLPSEFHGKDEYNPNASSSEHTVVQEFQQGFVRANRLLQDAYINYHSEIIPHHDFTVGQFKPPAGEEAYRNSGQLDFVERAMINQFGNQRDLGIMVHGTWWDDRFQYWIAGMDGAGSYHNTFASQQNRSDDGDAKDLAFRVAVRPVWREENWGSLELGYARQQGTHGEAGRGWTALGPTVDGLSLEETSANRQYAWVWYRPGGPVRGWWLRGEWARFLDRLQPGLIVTNAVQRAPAPFSRQGWYGATGYKLSESIWSERLKASGNWFIKALNDIEFAYRYEIFSNLLVEDAVNHAKTDAFNTSVHTFGVNYYWKGYNVRTQVNCLIVDESEGHNVSPLYSLAPNGNRIREVKNNVFIINHQVQW